MPIRPQVRVSLSTRFNEVVEADHFQCNGSSYLLIVDRLFTFKGGGLVTSYKTDDTMQTFLDRWISIFGPPKTLVCDQGSSLASASFAAFCAKFSIERRHGGADASRPAQHTSTGLF